MATDDTSTLTQSRAEAKYVRLSARKARVVLDHIRGRSVARGPDDPRVHAARRSCRHREGAALGRCERRVGARPRRRRARDPRRLRRRGPDAQALARPRPWPRQSHPQAHVPYHPDRRREPEGRRRGRSGRPKSPPRRTPRHPTHPPATRSRSRARRSVRRRRRRRLLPDGPEDPSWRPTRRCHPRLEVELVHRQEGVRRLHPRGCPHPRAHHRQAVPRRPVRHPDPQGQAADHGRHLHGPSRAS